MKQTVSIILDLSGQGDYVFSKFLRYDDTTFLILSRYGIVEANIANQTAKYLFGGSE